MKKIINVILVLSMAFSLFTVNAMAKTEYIPVAEGTYNGHTYHIFDEGLKWTEAKEYCEDAGGHLVTITTQEENEFILSLLESVDYTKCLYWLGASEAETWEWVTGEPFEYTNWQPGEPTNDAGQNYMTMYTELASKIISPKTIHSKWIDNPNEGVGAWSVENSGFICEWDYVRSSFGSEISEWATDEIEEAYNKQLIPESLVGADLTQPITRAEFAAVSIKTYELMANTTALPVVNNPFTDTNDIEVLKAFNVGITTGISETEFAPDVLLNREQAATMLTRVFKKTTMTGWTIAADEQFKLSYNKPDVFADDSIISDWAKDSVYFMAANGIINGVGGNKFAPQNTTTEEEATGYANATREQALIIATRIAENLK